MMILTKYHQHQDVDDMVQKVQKRFRVTDTATGAGKWLGGYPRAGTESQTFVVWVRSAVEMRKTKNLRTCYIFGYLE